MSDLLNEMPFSENVRAALNEGKLWRAKEILRGRIGSLKYSPELYEQYGVVLLAMQDLLQAGKYLFFSGTRRPEYELPIEIFLGRHGKTGKAIVDSLPASARSRPLAELPSVVRDELVRRGLPQEKVRASVEEARYSSPSRLSQQLVLLGCAAALLLVLVCAVAGVPVVLRFLASNLP